MIIENLRIEESGDKIRSLATVSWENCDRPVKDFYFEIERQFAEGWTCNPHSFLVALTIPAMHFGEERVFINEEICPELKDGLVTSMNWLQHWYYGPEKNIVKIESETPDTIIARPEKRSAGLFFSGGIDSLAALRTNRLNFPASHPYSIKDGLLVYGLELDRPEAFDYVKHFMSVMAQEADITLIPVNTNIYLEYRQDDKKNDFDFWIYKFQGAALAAVAHAFAHRLSVVSIAATFDLPSMDLWGSHPLLDPNYSSIDLKIKHEGIVQSRLEKVKLIANWDFALKNLRVCNQGQRYEKERLNCGKCEKCVRTMLELLAAGVLDRADSFAENDVTAELAYKGADVHDAYVKSCYQELLTPLREINREDLADAIRDKIKEFDEKNTWKGKLKDLPRQVKKAISSAKSH